MLTLSIVSLYSIINQFFWPMLRILALFSTAPIFNEKGIDRKTKVALAVIIALLIGPNIPNSHI
ncbi:flagellar biosynthetic protein FliR, partial [Yersinia bercovieri]